MTSRNVDPIVELAMIIKQNIQDGVDILPYNRLGVVVSVDPLLITPDGFGQSLEFDKGDFLVSDHLRLEVNDRVLLLPINRGSQYWVLSKFSIEVLPLNAIVGHEINDTFVGLKVFASANGVTRYPTLFSLTWNTIRGSVGGVLRVLTHLLHYHTFSPNTVTTSTDAGPGMHSHTVTLPNTQSATNPE